MSVSQEVKGRWVVVVYPLKCLRSSPANLQSP